MAWPDKVAGVRSLAGSAKDAATVILIEYCGLSVRQMKELCLALNGGVRYAVARSKLSKPAFRETGVKSPDEYFVGSATIVFVGHNGDLIAAAEVISKSAKKDPALVVKGGLMDGNVMDTEDVKELAPLEFREVLLVESAGVLKVSMYRVVAVMVAPASKAIRIIDALREKQTKAA